MINCGGCGCGLYFVVDVGGVVGIRAFRAKKRLTVDDLVLELRPVVNYRPLAPLSIVETGCS